MNNEQIAEQIANELWPEAWIESGDFRILQNHCKREIAKAAALRALEHQEKRIAELEAEYVSLVKSYREEELHLRGKIQEYKRWLKEANGRCESLKSQLAERDALLRECNDYLNTNEYTSIGNRSILHRKINALIGEEVK